MKLFLEDGSVIEGVEFGTSLTRERPLYGEVVFNTSMVGYPESLTDPSYAGQILVCTYPLIGNYGVPDPSAWESSHIHIAGLVVSHYCGEHYSHHEAQHSLGTWLRKARIPAISGVDTRALTLKLREKGVMLGAFAHTKPKSFIDPNKENLVAHVSIKQKQVYGSGPKVIIAIDCGMKENIVRSLVHQGITLVRVPWDYDFTKEKYDALFISNGPGDPTTCVPTIAHVQHAIKNKKPILGICLGVQILALAAGAKTYKLPFGHRGQNQPCIETATKRCYITSQNHGFAVNERTLSREWKVWFTNANDMSVEGIRHTKKPWRAVQFHPEAAPGPTDTVWIFDEFIRELTTL